MNREVAIQLMKALLIIFEETAKNDFKDAGRRKSSGESEGKIYISCYFLLSLLNFGMNNCLTFEYLINRTSCIITISEMSLPQL